MGTLGPSCSQPKAYDRDHPRARRDGWAYQIPEPFCSQSQPRASPFKALPHPLRPGVEPERRHILPLEAHPGSIQADGKTAAAFNLFVLLIKTQLQRAAPVASIYPVDPFLNTEEIMGITISSVSKSPSEKGKHRSLEVSTVTPRSAKEHDTSGRGCCRHGHGR